MGMAKNFINLYTNKSRERRVVEWLSSWLAEQEVWLWGLIPRLSTWISEIGYPLLSSFDMAEIPLKQCKSSVQPTNLHQQIETSRILWLKYICSYFANILTIVMSLLYLNNELF